MTAVHPPGSYIPINRYLEPMGATEKITFDVNTTLNCWNELGCARSRYFKAVFNGEKRANQRKIGLAHYDSGARPNLTICKGNHAPKKIEGYTWVNGMFK